MFRPLLGADWIVGVVGPLQFEVLKERISAEYGIKVHFEPAQAHAARWVSGGDGGMIKAFTEANKPALFEDHDATLVFLARNPWHLESTMKEWPDLSFDSSREQNLTGA